MSVTRREFLGCAASAAALALPLDLRRLGRDRRPIQPNARCVLLDLGAHCAIPDSWAGYESALTDLDAAWMRADGRSVPRCALIVVPAALEISPSVARLLLSRARSGATVLLESGAGFADEGDPAFREHRDVLREHLRLGVEAPRCLWPRHSSTAGIPYVEYGWPAAAMVRDFSRAVPVAPREARDEIIARVDALPVALRRTVGRGALVFLGSPLGPALRAGDAEARRWLADVIAAAAAISG